MSPTLVFAAGLIAGWFLTLRVPTPYLGSFVSRILGGILMALGVLLALSAI